MIALLEATRLSVCLSGTRLNAFERFCLAEVPVQRDLLQKAARQKCSR